MRRCAEGLLWSAERIHSHSIGPDAIENNDFFVMCHNSQDLVSPNLSMRGAFFSDVAEDLEKVIDVLQMATLDATFAGSLPPVYYSVGYMYRSILS